MLKRVLKTITIFAILLLTVSSAAFASETIRNTWMVVEQGEKPVGFGYDKLYRSSDGLFHYVSESTMQVGFLGSAPRTITQYLEMVADESYLAKSFKLVVDVGGTRTQVLGTVDRTTVDGVEYFDTNVVVINPDNNEFKSFWREEKPLYFSSSFTDYVLSTTGLEVGQEYTARVFDFASLAPADFTMAVEEETIYEYAGKAVPVFSLVEKKANGVKTLVDATGESYWTYEPTQKLTIRKVEKDEIPELQSATMDALVVPSNISVNHPFRSVASRIRVSWQDVPFEDFSWNDNRQRLVERVTSETGQEALVEIKRDDRDFTGRVRLPVVNPVLEPYFGDGRFITASLPEIQAIVREVVGDETDGWAATKKLVEWVFNYIEPAMIPETLTTKQILEKKSGKCSEYAVLFASVARTAGIPTRIALGERYQDGVWVGHMWNEVWLGEWVAVDASHNQVAPDALLLKFVDSPDVMGTQKVRYGLAGQLGITIEEVEVPADESSGATELKTGIEGQTYTNADFACRITAPEGWNLMEAKEQGLPMLVIQPSGVPEAQALLVMFSAPAGSKPEQILSSRIPALQGALPGFSLVSQETSSIGEYPAAVGTWTFDQGVEFRQQNWIVINGDLGYLFVFTGVNAKWADYEPVFQSVRDSFELFK
ncbi:MAG: transglutaminase-like domain-containing protein [Bacillota bacterium]